MRNKLYNTWLVLLGIMVFVACHKEFTNPYEGITAPTPQDSIAPDAYPYGSFAWLHANIFKTTCANSGCHDGTFEPDFRTIYSSYNSLVYRPVISNDFQNTYQYRVVPGDTVHSLLHARLYHELPNSSGIMPLVVDASSQWESRMNEFRNAIDAWILDGAKDMFNHPAPNPNGNQLPMVGGLAAFPVGNSTTPFERDPNSIFGIGAIQVPQGISDVWVLPYDDNAFLTNFAYMGYEISLSPTNFNPVQSGVFTVQNTSVNALDFGNSINSFYYKAPIDFSAFSPGQTVYMRVRMNDGIQTTDTYLPDSDSQYFWYLIFSFKIV